MLEEKLVLARAIVYVAWSQKFSKSTWVLVPKSAGRNLLEFFRKRRRKKAWPAQGREARYNWGLCSTTELFPLNIFGCKILLHSSCTIMVPLQALKRCGREVGSGFVWWMYTVQYMTEACKTEISSGACTATVASSPGGCSLGEPGTLSGSDDPQLLQPPLLFPRLQKQPAQR